VWTQPLCRVVDMAGMRKHHTKNKGDLGVLHAQLDLAKKGYAVLLALTEHEAFDPVAYKDGRFFRVQVKYRTAAAGVIGAPFSTCWADRHGTHTVPIDRDALELYCIYCPDTDRCYYVDPKTVVGKVFLPDIAAEESSSQTNPVGERLPGYPEDSPRNSRRFTRLT